MPSGGSTDGMKRLRVANWVVAAAAAGSLGAQNVAPASTPAITVDAHWLPYLGCWDTAADGLRGPMTCLLSTSDPRIIELATLSGDSAIVRERYDMTGTPVPYARDGCTGTQVTGWSLNERSFHVRTEVACGGGEPEVTTSVFTMRTETSFVRLQSMKVKNTTAVRVIEHRLAADTRQVSLDVLGRVPGADQGVVRNARSEALKSLVAADVLDALRTLDPVLVEAFIAGHGQKVLFGARDLRMLSSNGVPDRVLDMMIAVSRPEQFTLSEKGEPEFRRREDGVRTPQRPSNAALLATIGMADCLGYGSMYSGLVCGRGYDLYQGCYGNGFYGGFYPVVGSALVGNYVGACGDLYRYPRDIVVGYPSTWIGGGTPNATPPARLPGRVVNGSGYAQGSSSAGGGTARPVEPVSSSVGSAGSSSVDRGGYSSPSSSSSSAGASSAGSAPRTAKERP